MRKSWLNDTNTCFLLKALEQTRRKLASYEGRNEYRKRAGIEGTISQEVRRGTLSTVQIQWFEENIFSGRGDGKGDQYCAGSQLSR